MRPVPIDRRLGTPVFKSEFVQTQFELLAFPATVSSTCALVFFASLSEQWQLVVRETAVEEHLSARMCALAATAEDSPAGSGGRGGLSSNDASDEPFSKCLNTKGRCFWCSAAQSTFDESVIAKSACRDASCLWRVAPVGDGDGDGDGRLDEAEGR